MSASTLGSSVDHAGQACEQSLGLVQLLLELSMRAGTPGDFAQVTVKCDRSSRSSWLEA